LYENAYRAHRGQSIKENNEESAKLYAEFSAVSEKNPVSWNYGRRDSAEKIGTVDKKNRMICFPCKSIHPLSLLTLPHPSHIPPFSLPKAPQNIYIQSKQKR
jgi:hypothetical protein